MRKEHRDCNDMQSNIEFIKEECRAMNLKQLSEAVCVAIGMFASIHDNEPGRTYSASEVCEFLASLYEIAYGRNLLKETGETDD